MDRNESIAMSRAYDLRREDELEAIRKAKTNTAEGKPKGGPLTEEERRAEILYGNRPAGEAAPTQEDKPLEPPKQHSDTELGEMLYPPHDDNYPRIGPSGEVEDLVRDTDGRVLLRGFCQGHSENLLSGLNAHGLTHADLRDMQLLNLAEANLREADVRGATLGNLRNADIRGLIVDESTDISGADFAFAKLNLATYEALTRCKGFKSAKNLGRPFK